MKTIEIDETKIPAAMEIIEKAAELTDAQIRKIVTGILTFRGAEMDWWLNYLRINTGLENLTDYIFYPDFFGLDRQAGLDEIAEKIIADRM